MLIRLLKQYAHKNDRSPSDLCMNPEEGAKVISGSQGEGHRCEEAPLEITLEKRDRIGEMLQRKNYQIYRRAGKDFTTLRRVVEHGIDQGMEIIVNPPDVTEGRMYESCKKMVEESNLGVAEVEVEDEVLVVLPGKATVPDNLDEEALNTEAVDLAAATPERDNANGRGKSPSTNSKQLSCHEGPKTERSKRTEGTSSQSQTTVKFQAPSSQQRPKTTKNATILSSACKISQRGEAAPLKRAVEMPVSLFSAQARCHFPSLEKLKQPKAVKLSARAACSRRPLRKLPSKEDLLKIENIGIKLKLRKLKNRVLVESAGKDVEVKTRSSPAEKKMNEVKPSTCIFLETEGQGQESSIGQI